MSGAQIVVGMFAIVSVTLSVLAICRVATSRLSYKLLWIIGSAFGFVGVAADFGHPGDLYVQFGIQIPVIMIFWLFPGGGPTVKAMFPFIAVAALAKYHSSRSGPSG